MYKNLINNMASKQEDELNELDIRKNLNIANKVGPTLLTQTL